MSKPILYLLLTAPLFDLVPNYVLPPLSAAEALSFAPRPAARPAVPELELTSSNEDPVGSRRKFLQRAFTTASFALVGPFEARAAVISTQTPSVGTLSALTVEEAEKRFRAGRSSLEYLLKNYDEICEGGGDNVRRYLGTVGTTSGLFGIQKAMKVLADRTDDIVEYAELSTEIEKTIQQADGSAYMAIFVVTSTSTTPPARYFKDAKIEIERCAKAMDELAAMIGLQI